MKLSALTLASSIACASAFAPSFNGARSTTELNARTPFISGNWKLNPQSKAEAVTLATDIASTITDASPDAEVALFVPYVFIEAAMEAVGDKLMIGAEVSFIALIDHEVSVLKKDETSIPIFYWECHVLTSLFLSIAERVSAQKSREPLLEQ